MDFILRHDIPFEIEAKRAIVVHDLEKLANNILSDLNIEKVSDIHHETKKMCQQHLSWKDKQFWEELPHPNNNEKQITIGNSKLVKQIESSHLLLNNRAEEESKQKEDRQTKDKNTTKTYFDNWRTFAKNKKHHKNQLIERIEQKEKLDKFFKMIKRCQNKKYVYSSNTSIKLQHTRNNNQNKISEDNSVTEHDNKLKMILPTANSTEQTCFQHRFKAQQDIILMQKQKLIDQEKRIHELQFGKLSDDIKQSMEEAQKEIKETLAKCSIKVKCQIKPMEIESAEDNLIKFHLQSGKAPKIMQQMEERALEREQKRQAIFERKRLLDQKRKAAIELEIQKKQALDEEERKRSLMEIKERRRREMEIQQQIQIRKQKFLDDCLKAELFYTRKLKTMAFKGFLKLMTMKEDNTIKSEEFYDRYLKQKIWKGWMKFLTDIERSKMTKVEQLYNFKLKKKVLSVWFNVYTISIQHLQVAQDLYELRLHSKMFIHWHRYTCTQYVLQIKNLQKAEKHHNRRLLFDYFYQWKTLQAVIQLEKAKEEKKQRWREKVWEILPDYEPPIED